MGETIVLDTVRGFMRLHLVILISIYEELWVQAALAPVQEVAVTHRKGSSNRQVAEKELLAHAQYKPTVARS